MKKPTIIRNDYEGLAERVLEEVEKEHMATLIIDLYEPKRIGKYGEQFVYDCRIQLTLEPYVHYDFQYTSRGDGMFRGYESRKILHKKLEKEFKKVGLVSEIVEMVRTGTGSAVHVLPGGGHLYVFKKEK